MTVLHICLFFVKDVIYLRCVVVLASISFSYTCTPLISRGLRASRFDVCMYVQWFLVMFNLDGCCHEVSLEMIDLLIYRLDRPGFENLDGANRVEDSRAGR